MRCTEKFYRAIVDQSTRHDKRDFLTPYCDNLGRWCEYSLFAVTRRALLEVGLFDENIFPAYYEDDDYRIRLKV